MLPFLALNWRWLAPAVVAVGLMGWVGVLKVENASLRASIIQEKANSAKADALSLQRLNDLNEAVAEKNRLSQEYTDKLEANHAQSLQDIEAAKSRYAGDYLGVVSKLRACQAGAAKLPGSNGPAQSQDSAQGSSGGLSDGVAGRFERIGQSANKLAALVRDVCIPFANQK